MFSIMALCLEFLVQRILGLYLVVNVLSFVFQFLIIMDLSFGLASCLSFVNKVKPTVYLLIFAFP